MAEYFIINNDEPVLVCISFVTVLIINIPITVQVLCHKFNVVLTKAWFCIKDIFLRNTFIKI